MRAAYALAAAPGVATDGAAAAPALSLHSEELRGEAVVAEERREPPARGAEGARCLVDPAAETADLRATGGVLLRLLFLGGAWVLLRL